MFIYVCSHTWLYHEACLPPVKPLLVTAMANHLFRRHNGEDNFVRNGHAYEHWNLCCYEHDYSMYYCIDRSTFSYDNLVRLLA